MKTRLGLGLLLCVTLALRAVNVGDTYQQVIKEKGQPGAKMEAGDTMILRYSDEVVRLKAGKVTAVETPKARETMVSATAVAVDSPGGTPAPKPSSSPGRVTWTTDHRAALAVAKEQNKKVFMFFTGSDWCVWCKRLQAEILTTPEFGRYAADNLVLLELDFPNSKPQSSVVKSQNATLARRYQIEGYPTVIVLDPNGKNLAKLGYQEGGPAPFIKRLKSL
jgi:thiol-disulfide isomerase/thioredoxin